MPVYRCEANLKRYWTYNSLLFMFAIETDGEFHNGATSISSALCEVSFIGVFPSMKITDIQGEGVASQLSKATLWKMLSIDRYVNHLGMVFSNGDSQTRCVLENTVELVITFHYRLPHLFKDYTVLPAYRNTFVLSCRMSTIGDVMLKFCMFLCRYVIFDCVCLIWNVIIN